MGILGELTEWELLGTPAGQCADPAELTASPGWIPAGAPGTVAEALRAAGAWSARSLRDLDADDWWWRTQFDGTPGDEAELCFAGIATIAEVFFNGELVARSSHMFVPCQVSVRLQAANRLDVVCRALRAHTVPARPRARWKTFMVDLPQARWVRTALRGRIRAWRPLAAPVGLTGRVVVRTPDTPRVERLMCRREGDAGVVELSGRLTGGHQWTLHVGSWSVPLPVGAGGEIIDATVRLPAVTAWMPHTHGRPTLYEAAVTSSAGERIDLGRVGFRTVGVDRTGGGFTVSVNGVDVFCRGACWTPPDPLAAAQHPDALRASLELAVAAGVNMVRVTGVSTYEQTEFYALCDELGVMVWQDFMFANFDYPAGDEAFAAAVRHEADAFLDRGLRHACLTVLCGGSDVEQQASMMGIADDGAVNEIGRALLAEVCANRAPLVPYVANTPSGGALPIVCDEGPSSYFGVGAYLRPLEDARRARPRFATECLAMSHVPSDEVVAEALGPTFGIYGPDWKFGTGRDAFADWDFDDVRDFYVRQLFGDDPGEVRRFDRRRFLDLGRAASCTAFESSLSEWRRTGSGCGGAIVLNWQDAVAGAGWGMLDHTGQPKSVYYGFARTARARAVTLTDEGLNGLRIHCHNDHPVPLAGVLTVRLFSARGRVVDEGRSEIEVPSHGSRCVAAEALLAGFRDLTFAYRFGPPPVDVVHVQLTSTDGDELEAFHLPSGRARARVPDLGIDAAAVWTEHDAWVEVATEGFAQFVQINCAGWQPTDNFFHLAPGARRRIALRAVGAPTRLRGAVRCLNLLDEVGFHAQPGVP